MESYHFLVAFWPIAVSMGVVIATLAVALYRINQNAKLKQALFKEDGTLIYVPAEGIQKEIDKIANKTARVEEKIKEIDVKALKIEKHADICAIASYSIKEFISSKLDHVVLRIEEKLDLKAKEQNAKIVEQNKRIDENARSIKTVLDQTKHLKSANEG